VTKRALTAGKKLDGEGGFTCYAKALPADLSRRIDALPIGLAHGWLKRDVPAGAVLSMADVDLPDHPVLAMRAEMRPG
jgi:predicted homoserine dehydrogenase-like protein